MINTAMLKQTIINAIEYLDKQGVELPADIAASASVAGISIKGRDPREPGRRQKLRMEARLKELLTKRFKRQMARVKEELQARKSIGVAVDTADIDAEITMLFYAAILEGIDLFDDNIPLDVDYSSSRNNALEYARTYSTEWLQGLDNTSSETVRRALEYYIQTEGATLGSAVEILSTVFDEARAELIAVTEITRAYAEGNQLAGEDMAEQWPGVEVTKIWFTNNDDLVCPICGALDGKEININDDFNVDGEDYENPPAHPNCRCWTSVGTK